ncbi:ABC transporter permease protein YxdM [compost metagenome]
MFVCTSVLYSSYYNVKENTEALYPYSYQYISLPENTLEDEQKDITFIETTLSKAGNYDAYYSEFKTDEKRRIAFMSVTNYNSLGLHEKISLKKNEYYVVAGNEGVLPSTETIHEYLLTKPHYAGLEKQNIFSTGLQNVYYIVPDAVYETIDYPVYKVFAYELENWTEKIDVAKTLASGVPIDLDVHLIASKIELYNAEKSVKSIMFFIGFMLSLIFLSAAMSILYFYLQTSLEGEKKKYAGIRKIGLSVKEIASVVTRELATLIFIPFTFASIILFVAMLSMRHYISMTFYQMTAIGVGVFLLLFVISFCIIRWGYLNKLVKES